MLSFSSTPIAFVPLLGFSEITKNQYKKTVPLVVTQSGRPNQCQQDTEASLDTSSGTTMQWHLSWLLRCYFYSQMYVARIKMQNNEKGGIYTLHVAGEETTTKIGKLENWGR